MFGSRVRERYRVAGLRSATARQASSLTRLGIQASRYALVALALTLSPLAFAGIACTGTVVSTPPCPTPTVSGTIFVGNGAVGTLSVDAGSTFTANTLSLGTGGTGNGTVTITGTASGPQTVVNLLGPPNGSTINNPLEVGNWGTGLMTVSGGAQINGLGDINCISAHCNTFIGQTAGSSGTLTLTGAGTTASLGGSFLVGFGVAFTAAGDGFNFGTPGLTATGVVNVQNGAALNTYNATLGAIGTSFANTLAPPSAVAHVTVDGTNSTWTVSNNPVTGFTAGISMASGQNTTATLDVTHGGQVTIGDSTSYLQVGNGGSATLTITGGGAITAGNVGIGNTPTGAGTVTVGDGVGLSVLTATNSMGVGNQSTTTSTLTINSGGHVNVTGTGGLGIGNSTGSSGRVVVDGGLLDVLGSNAFLGVGGNGSGDLTVRNGGTVNAVNLGLGGTGGVGTMTVGNGVGQSVVTVSNSMGVGNGSAQTSLLTINVGGSVQMSGGFGLGIANGTGTNGSVVVDGGQLALSGMNDGIGVGGNGNGALTVRNGGVVTLTGTNAGIFVANSAGSTGNVLVDGGGSQISMSGLNSGFGVGNGGTGSATIQNGASVSMTGQNNGIGVGNQGSGSLFVTSGSTLTTESLTVAGGQGSTGVVNIVGTSSGPQTVVTLNGPASASNGVNVLQVGNWGNGTMDVSGGAIVTAAVGNANCATTFCGSFVGNGAGSTGSLTLRDAGTTMSLGGPLFVGNAAVFTNPPNNFTFGTPGGTTTATLQVLNGATLNTYTATISTGPSGPNAIGTEHTNAHVTIDGAGSTWNVASDPINTGNSQAFIGLAQTANATATIDITHGGRLNVTGSGSNPQPQMNMTGGGGQAGGSSTVNVDGAGSAIVFNGDTGLIQVGRNGGTAELAITNGAKVYGGGANGLTFMNVGRVGSNATLTIDGAGSALTLSGVASAVNGNTAGAGAFMTIGRDAGGIGNANVTGGALLYINDGGQAANNGATGLRLGRDATSTGVMMVSGLNTQVIIEQTGSGTSLPTVIVGQAGTGQMTITDHATLVVNGPSERDVIVGNAPGGHGTLTVSNGAQLTASWFTTGNNGGTGTSTIDGATVLLNGIALNPDQTIFGASVRVGRGTGSTGTLNLINGAQIIIDTATAGSNINLGGTSALLGGNGTLNMSGGSSISFVGAGATPAVNIGHSGTGLFTMTGGSTLSLPNDGSIVLGNRASGNGTLQLGGGSTIDTGFLTVGNNGHGTVTMTGGTLGVHGTNPDGDALFIVGGNNGSVGTFLQSGGGVSFNQSLVIGWQTGSSGTYTLSGGTLNGGGVTVGDRGAGVFVMSASGAASTINNVNGLLIVAGDTSSTGSYTMTGNNAHTSVNFTPGGLGPTDPPGVNGIDPITNQPRPAPNGAMGIGVGGVGTFTQGAANFSDPGNTVSVAGDLAVGVFAGGVGSYTLNTGTLTVGGKLVIGGQSQDAGNVFTQKGGSVTVTGTAAGNPDYVGLGGNQFSGALIVGGGINDLGGGTGKYVMNGGNLSANAVLVGNNGGTGTFTQTGGSVNTGSLSLGTASTGTYGMSGVGATLNVTGNLIVGDAGTGTFTHSGGTNTIGGQLILGNQATGNGTYQASNGASITLTGAGATVVIGQNGTGVMTMIEGSTLVLPADGKVIVGAHSGASGTVELQGGSSIVAGVVFGIGHDGTNPTGAAAANVYLDQGSSITATNIHLGDGCLGGNGGILHGNFIMDGQAVVNCAAPILPIVHPDTVIPFGILHPGRSPGVLVFDGGFQYLAGTIVLQVESDGLGGFLTDQLIFADGTVPDLTNVKIEFAFVGDTDPNAFADTGNWILDTFLKIFLPDDGNPNTPPVTEGISALGGAVSFGNPDFVAQSDAYVFESFTFTVDSGVYDPTTGESTVVAEPVAGTIPEPGTLALMVLGMAWLMLYGQRRNRQLRCSSQSRASAIASS